MRIAGQHPGRRQQTPGVVADEGHELLISLGAHDRTFRLIMSP